MLEAGAVSFSPPQTPMAMSDPITRNFNASLKKTYEWLEDVERALPFGDRQIAYHVLRGVLHVLRDRLTAEEACDLAAELPIMLRGMYFEGWSPANKPVKMKPNDFLDRVQSLLEPAIGGLGVETCVAAVLHVLGKRISAGEIADIRGALPKQFESLWPA